MPATTSRDYLKIRNDLDPELAGSFAHWRREMLRACVNFSLANAATSRRSIEAALTELRRTLTQLGRPEHSVVMTLDHLLDAFGAMCSWVEMSVAGLGDAAAQLVAAKARAQLAKEQLAEVVHPAFHSSVNGVIEAVLACKELNDAGNVAALLSRVTVPPPVVPWRDAYDFPTAVTTPLAETSGPAIVRVMLELNGQPWSTPQIVRAGVVHTLDAHVLVPEWPEGSDRLIIDYRSTLPAALYHVTTLTLERHASEKRTETTLRGHASFPTAQNFLADPAVIELRATFQSTSNPDLHEDAPIIGYRKLSVRIADPTRVPLLTRYPALDARLAEVVDEIQRTTPGVTAEHLQDFVELLAAIVNFMGINAQNAVFREGNPPNEAAFQQELLRHLRGRLGLAVQEAPRQGAGITDIVYRSAVAELKVERDVADRQEMIGGYLAQPTQYGSAVGSQLGILCVLDLTEKTHPPAAPQNNIGLHAPPVHGFAEGAAQYPSRIVSVIIDGNIRRPSSYSR